MTAVTLRLSKHHSAGNDFLVALVSEPLPGSAADLARELFGDPAAAAAALCHRRRGIGADGLVLGVESDDQPRMLAGGDGGDGEALGVQAGSVRMRLWNSDGSEAEISGNGLRCLAQAVARSRGVSEIDIDTPAGLRRCWIEPDGEPVASSALGRVEMGAVTLDALECAVATAESDLGQLAVALAQVEGFTGRWRTGSVGNPHVVVEVADPDAVDLESSGLAVESCFDSGANVHFAAAAGFRHVRMRIWERGAGVTESCGSGAAVAAAVFDAWETWADPGGDGDRNGADEIVVVMPGGETRVHLGPSVALTGPVVHVADIEVLDMRPSC